MPTVLAKETSVKDFATVQEIETSIESKEVSASVLSLAAVPSLGVPADEKRFWWQRDKSFNPNAIATQVSFSPY